MTSTLSPTAPDRRAPGTTSTTLTGRQRRHDDRRRALVSEALATLRGESARHQRPRALEAARTMLDRLNPR